MLQRGRRDCLVPRVVLLIAASETHATIQIPNIGSKWPILGWPVECFGPWPRHSSVCIELMGIAQDWGGNFFMPGLRHSLQRHQTITLR